MKDSSRAQVPEALIGRTIEQARDKAQHLAGRIAEVFTACADAWAAAASTRNYPSCRMPSSSAGAFRAENYTTVCSRP